MKKSLIAIAALAVSMTVLEAGTIEKYKTMDNIMIGKSTMMVRKNGTITISTANGLIVNISMPLQTNEGWSKHTASAVFDDSQKNVITYQNTFPEKTANPVKFTRKVELKDDDTIIISYAAESALKKNIKELFCRINLGMKQYEGSDIEINGQKFKVENVTKYGWFRKTADAPEIVFFKDGVPALRIKASSKMNIVGEATKDSSVGIRLYCTEDTSGELTISYK